MKKLLLLFITVFLMHSGKSQAVFCPPGAQWTYAFNGMSWAGARNINYVGDSTLASGEVVKKLAYPTFFRLALGPQGSSTLSLIKQNSDTVFIKNKNTNGSWQILYNFAATSGQQWIATFKDSISPSKIMVSYTTQVISVSTVTLNNLPHKRMRVVYKYLDPNNFVPPLMRADTTTITERIGSQPYLFYFLGQKRWSDPTTPSGLMCYTDNSTGTMSGFYKYDCTVALGVSENKISGNSIKLYPQPAGNLLTIETGTALQNCDIKITDALGRLVLSTTPQINDATLKADISTLATGVYMIRVFNNGTLLGTGKIIKE